MNNTDAVLEILFFIIKLVFGTVLLVSIVYLLSYFVLIPMVRLLMFLFK